MKTIDLIQEKEESYQVFISKGSSQRSLLCEREEYESLSKDWVPKNEYINFSKFNTDFDISKSYMTNYMESSII